MFRTRDFLLLFVTIVFLLVAIGSTVLTRLSINNTDDSRVKFTEVIDREYEVELYVPEQIAREEKLSEMRRKVAESREVVIASADINNINDDVFEETGSDGSKSETLGVVQCDDYKSFTGSWPQTGVLNEVVEGGRIFFVDGIEEVFIPAETATGTPTIFEKVTKDVILQLPVASVSKVTQHCLKTDVIGVAKDGSLIRNHEVGLYSVFGSEVLIGYALDGLPIYGVSSDSRGICGEVLNVAGYRYVITAESETIINCFISQPVAI
ncbi:hypothetical protein KC851_02470 [Candidatus Kaiserbacteria bacterium]|nr:hypothetical protein [Candidatus Kaiserbacteria bacterium]